MSKAHETTPDTPAESLRSFHLIEVNHQDANPHQGWPAGVLIEGDDWPADISGQRLHFVPDTLLAERGITLGDLKQVGRECHLQQPKAVNAPVTDIRLGEVLNVLQQMVAHVQKARRRFTQWMNPHHHFCVDDLTYHVGGSAS